MKKLLLICLFVSSATWALPNPAAVNCTKKGYHYVLINNVGLCLFPDHSFCEEWAFFRGQCKKGQFFSPKSLQNPPSSVGQQPTNNRLKMLRKRMLTTNRRPLKSP